MKLFHTYIILFIVLVTAGCNHKPADQGNKNNQPISEYRIKYAKGFKVQKYPDYTEVSVINPWDTTKLLQHYLLIDRNKPIPENLPQQGTVIKVPLQSVTTYSTIHCSTLNELGELDIVKGVCEPQYIKLDKIQQGIKDGTIQNLGQASSPNVEKIIMLSPDAIMTSPINGSPYGNVEKTKIPIIETPDYTEPEPLGRAEWIRFYSLFLNKEKLADSLFSITEKNYLEVKNIVATVSYHPTVFLDTKYGANWNISGGQSFIAKMLSDAGAEYVWADNGSTKYMPLSFETVLDKAGDADLWLIRYFADENMTYRSLEKEYKPYSYFKAFKEHHIYGCNTQRRSFYEDLPIHPDYILKDMAYVFHPELFPDYSPRYYTKLEE